MCCALAGETQMPPRHRPHSGGYAYPASCSEWIVIWQVNAHPNLETAEAVKSPLFFNGTGSLIARIILRNRGHGAGRRDGCIPGRTAGFHCDRATIWPALTISATLAHREMRRSSRLPMSTHARADRAPVPPVGACRGAEPKARGCRSWLIARGRGLKTSSDERAGCCASPPVWRTASDDGLRRRSSFVA